MSRTLLLVKTDDINKIHDEIDRHMFETGETNPYLFMSKKTFAAITNVTRADITFDFLSLDGVIGKYHGYKIYANNELDFGEVEIR